MTRLEMLRVEILGSSTDTTKDVVLGVKLSQAEEVGLRRKYPFGTLLTTLPVEYDNWIVRAAVELYNRMGVEGQTSHNENGVSRSFDSATGLSKALLNEIVSTVGVMVEIV